MFPFMLRNRAGLVGPETRQQFLPTVYDDNKLALLQELGEESLQLQTYDLNDGNLLYRCPLGISYCNSVPFAKLDGPEEIVTGGDQFARVRTVQGTQHTERIVHDHRVTRCALCPDGQIVATAGWQNVRLTERTGMSEMFRHANDIKPSFAILPHQTRVSQLTFSSDSRLLATVQFDGLVRVWDIAGAKQPKIDIPVEADGNLAMFSNGPIRCLLTGIHHRNGSARRFREIDEKTGATRVLVPDIAGQLRGVASSNNGKHFALAIAGESNEHHHLRLFQCVSTAKDDARRNEIQLKESIDLVPLPGDPRAIAAHPSLNRYAVLCGNGDTVIVNGDSGKVAGVYRVSNVSTSSPHYPRHNGLIAWTPDGESILQVGNSSSSGLRIFNAVTCIERFPVFKNDGVRIQQFDISPDGRVAAIAGGRTNSVTILDLKTGKQVTDPIEHPAVVYSARFSPDGLSLVSSCRDGQARIIDWRTGKIMNRALEHQSDVVDACFANHGKAVISISHDKLARVWDVETGLQVCPPVFVGDGMMYLQVDSELQMALVSGRQPNVVLIKLDPPSLPKSSNCNDLFQLAELVAHASIVNAGTVKLTTEDWITRWERYRETGMFKEHIQCLFPE